MSQPGVRYVTLLGPTTITTSATFPDINIPQGFQAGSVAVTLSTTSGTTPTWDVFLQKQIPQCASTDVAPASPTGAAVWDDILHFTQLTTNVTQMANLGNWYTPANTANATTLTTADWARQDAALGAGTLRMGPIGGDWRVKVTVGGTTPSTVMSVVAILLPYGG
jgi:hypothetical protein